MERPWATSMIRRWQWTTFILLLALRNSDDAIQDYLLGLSSDQARYPSDKVKTSRWPAGFIQVLLNIIRDALHESEC